jgi:hypothetical protein
VLNALGLTGWIVWLLVAAIGLLIARCLGLRDSIRGDRGIGSVVVGKRGDKIKVATAYNLHIYALSLRS